MAVTDWKGGVYNAKGLDVDKLIEWAAEHKTVAGFPDAEQLAGDKIFELDVDILDPGRAREPDHDGQRAEDSRRRSSPRAPTARRRPDAHKHLHERGVFVIPDILANAGGVTTSYFEWVQDRHGYFWSEKEVNERLERKMDEAFHDVLETSLKYKTDMRTAAYIVAINRVATVTKLRGMYA